MEPPNLEALEKMQLLSALAMKIKSAILDYWERPIPITVFVPVRIFRKK